LHCNDHGKIWVRYTVEILAASHCGWKLTHQMPSNDKVERRGVALPATEADLSRASTPS
jgi:hypothetical protein